MYLYNADTRAKLPAPGNSPYPIFAKRPAYETHYYEIFNQPNVTLIDIQPDPIRELIPSDLLTESALHHLDILILATGFDAVHGGLGAISITGLDTSTTLGQSWKNGKSSYLGLSVAGYPNLFYVYSPQSPAAWCNGPACAQYRGDWIADALTYMREHGKKCIDIVKGIAGHTLLPKAESWQFGYNVPGAVRGPLFLLIGRGDVFGDFGGR